MCTSIVEIVGADGAGKGSDGWFDLTHSVVSYDHPHHALLEEAITIDFLNAALGPGARVAVELTLEAAKELSGALVRAIAAAEIEESRTFARDIGRACAMRVLLTGGAGDLGQTLVPVLLDNGDTPVVLDIRAPKDGDIYPRVGSGSVGAARIFERLRLHRSHSRLARHPRR